MTKEPMTQYGYAKLTKELEWYKNEERPKTVAELDYARSLGDLKENAEYHAAKDRLAFIDAKIAELSDMLARAQVIDPATLPHKKVSFGSTVTLLDLDIEEEVEYTIVGAPESNPEHGLISIHSPLARALMGKEEGDEIHVNFGAKKMDFEVLKVTFKPIKLG
ncbi:MAG: transcription elongation factor GreA [Campylobacterales bacterium]